MKAFVSNKGERGTCSYCSQNATCFSIEALSQIVQTAFEQHYYRTSPYPTAYEWAMIKEYNDDWDRHGEPIVDAIMNAAGIPYEAACAIQAILNDQCSDYEAAKMGEELEFSTKSFYEKREPDDKRWQKEWNNFEHFLKTEARFFSRSASQLLTSVFTGVDTMTKQDGQSLIVDAGPGTNYSTIYRARSFQSNEKLKVALKQPDKDLGPPPSTAATAGRMNAHGISVFYGANNPKVALAEVRPPINSQVAIARFDIIRPIKLLDLTALSDIATNEDSIFNPIYKGYLEHIMFLRRLSERITMPVIPDHEIFDYLPTQAITDFLSTEYKPSLDGIIFPSVQVANGVNIVLFHKSARVEEIELPEGADVEVTLDPFDIDEERLSPEYHVNEYIPLEEEGSGKRVAPRHRVGRALQDSDQRPLTLRIELNAVRIHIVHSIEFHASDYPVSRDRHLATTEFPF